MSEHKNRLITIIDIIRLRPEIKTAAGHNLDMLGHRIAELFNIFFTVNIPYYQRFEIMHIHNGLMEQYREVAAILEGLYSQSKEKKKELIKIEKDLHAMTGTSQQKNVLNTELIIKKLELQEKEESIRSYEKIMKEIVFLVQDNMPDPYTPHAPGTPWRRSIPKIVSFLIALILTIAVDLCITRIDSVLEAPLMYHILIVCFFFLTETVLFEPLKKRFNLYAVKKNMMRELDRLEELVKEQENNFNKLSKKHAAQP